MSDTHEIAKLVQALSEARAELKIYKDNDKEKETEDGFTLVAPIGAVKQTNKWNRDLHAQTANDAGAVVAATRKGAMNINALLMGACPGVGFKLEKAERGVPKGRRATVGAAAGVLPAVRRGNATGVEVTVNRKGALARTRRYLRNQRKRDAKRQRTRERAAREQRATVRDELRREDGWKPVLDAAGNVVKFIDVGVDYHENTHPPQSKEEQRAWMDATYTRMAICGPH